MPVVTIGSFSAQLLATQPFGYEGDARYGLTARRWKFEAILTPAQEITLRSVYDTWRDQRIQDADTKISGVIGTTVSLTTATDTVSVTNLPCWFTAAPEIEQVGAYKKANFELVDAAQALQVILAEEERSQQQRNELDATFGTWTFTAVVSGGPDISVTVTLTKPPEAFGDGPSVALLSTGAHYITGPLVAEQRRSIEGITDAAGWAQLYNWYQQMVARTPAVGSWYPVTAPSVSTEAIIESGVKSTRYTVSVELVKIR